MHGNLLNRPESSKDLQELKDEKYLLNVLNRVQNNNNNENL